MKTETRKVYECEHCGRKMLSAGAMGYHEKWCKKNPTNKHKCFALCRHLKRTLNMHARKIEFQCMATGKYMYSFHLEKKHKYQYRNLPCDAIRMPLQCDKWEQMTIDEQYKRFDINE